MRKKFLFSVLTLIVTFVTAITFVRAGIVTNVNTYAELKTAINNGGVIRLTSNISVTELGGNYYSKYNYLFYVNKDTTIDLNGYTLSWDLGTTNEGFLSAQSQAMFFVSGTSDLVNDESLSISSSIVSYEAHPATLTIRATNGGKILIKPSDNYEGTISKIIGIATDVYELKSDGSLLTYKYTNSKGEIVASTLSKMAGQVINLNSGTIQIENNEKAIITSAYGISYASSTPNNEIINMSGGKILINSEASTSFTSTVVGISNSTSKSNTLNVTGGLVEVTGGYHTGLKTILGVQASTINISNATIAIRKVGEEMSSYLSMKPITCSSSSTSKITSGNVYMDKGTGTTGTFSGGMSGIIVEGGSFNFDISPYVNVKTKVGINNSSASASIFGSDRTLAYGVTEKVTNVARNVNTGEEYLSVLTAIEEATEGDTVRLFANDNIGNLALDIDKSLTVDFNGYVLTSERTCNSTSNCAINVNTADVTDVVVFTDTQATSHANAGKLNGSIVSKKGNVVVEKINIHPLRGTGFVIDGLEDTASLKLKGVKLLVDSTYYGVGSSWSAIYMSSTGLVTLENYTDDYKLIVDLTVEGSGKIGSLMYKTMSGISNVVINSGTFNITADNAYIFGKWPREKLVSVLGGTFNINGTTTTAATAGEDYPLSIEGGTFNFNVSDPNIKEGFTKQESDGKYTIVPGANSFEINGKGYNTITSALADVKNGDTIKLLNNYTTTSSITIDKNISFNLNGKTLNLNGNPAIYVKEGITNPLDVSQFEVKFVNNGYIGYYYKFDKAFSSLAKYTLVLNKNVSTSSSFSVMFGTRKIDLNGYNLIHTGSTNFIDVRTAISKNYPGTLELINSKSTESVLTASISAQAQGSVATIKVGKNVKITSLNNAISLFGNNEDDGSVVLDVNGSIVSTNGNAIIGQGNSNKTKININVGSLVKSEKSVAIYHPQEGLITVSGGEVTGTTAIAIKGGELVVNGGTINGIGTKFEPTEAVSSGSNNTGDAIYVEDSYINRDVKIKVTGGSLNSTNSQAVNKLFSTSDSKTSIILMGGTYSSNPSTYLAPGYESIKNANNKFVISKVSVPSGKFSISGTIINGDNSIVQVKQGGKVLYSVNVINGKYKVNNLAKGVYNIVLTNGVNTVTKILEVSKNTSLNMTLPLVGSAKLVILGTNTPDIIVDGINESAEGDVEIVLQATIQSSNDSNEVQSKIKETIKSESYEFYDFTLLVDDVVTSESQSIIKIAVPWNFSTTENISISRYHNDKVEVLKEVTSNGPTYEDGTYYLDKENNYIYIFVDRFSTYAIGYDKIEPKNPKTGDMIYLYIGLFLLAGCGMGAFLKNRKLNKMTK